MSVSRSAAAAAFFALFATLLGAGNAFAQECPVAGRVDDGYTLHLKNGDIFKVDKVVDDVTFMRHMDNRGNTLNAQELYRGLFTLATVGGKGRTVYSYDVDPVTFFPIQAEGYAEVGGMMIPESGRSTPVTRWWRVSGSGTKKLDSGQDREFLCVYSVRRVEAVTTWPDLGLEFRQQKEWSPTLNMVLYLKTEVWQHGKQTRVTTYDAEWIVEGKKTDG
jgi:hypothetical protein